MQFNKTLITAAIMLLTMGTIGVVPLAAQLQDPDNQQAPDDLLGKEPFYKRIHFGARGSVLFNNLMNDQSDTQSFEDTGLSQTIYSNSAAKRYGGGATVGIDLTDHFYLSVDLLYRRSGYDKGTVNSTQDTEDSSGVDTWGVLERTRADYWDVPILLRYYHKTVEDEGMRLFATGGFAIRTATGVTTYNEEFDIDNLRNTNATPTTPDNKTIPGAVVGVGVRLSDTMPVKVDLEARYTRWLNRTFESGSTRSNVNQGEFIVSFTF